MLHREIPLKPSDISDAVRREQVRMFDLANRKHGLSLKVLHAETGISTSTLSGWINGTSMMPLDGFVKIAAIRDFPNELLSLVLDVGGKSVSDADGDEGDIDDAVIAAAELFLAYAKARHPDSPGSIRIVHSEQPEIQLAARRVADRCGKISA